MTKWFDGFVESIAERALKHPQDDRWILYLTRNQLHVFCANQEHGSIGARHWELIGNVFVLHWSYGEEMLAKAKTIRQDKVRRIRKMLEDIDWEMEEEDIDNEKALLTEAKRILAEKLEH
jgi:hypothetical protein